MDTEPILPRQWRDPDPRLNVVTSDIISAAIEVQRHLGSGLLEAPYKLALAHELRLRGRDVDLEVPIHASYKGMPLPKSYDVDLVVDQEVAVEAKAARAFEDVHFSQLGSYLKFGNYQVGLLINFRSSPLKHGIRRLLHPDRRILPSGPSGPSA